MNLAADRVLFSTYPHQPTPVDPGLLVLSMGLSNTPILGDLYDLYTGVTGYDPITGQYLAGWERLTNIAGGLILLPGVTGSNVRHGVHAVESLIDSGDELAQFIGKACSFDEDTPVATSEGAIPIREIDVGDQVLAWDEVTGATGYYTVTAVWGHKDPVTVQLVINGETIDTTPEHPFFTTNGEWVAAGDLQVGDAIHNAAGESGIVEAVEFAATPQVMYNMTIADAHTYTVGDGEWLVHNDCSLGRRFFNRFSNDQGFSAAIDLASGITSMLPSTGELQRNVSEMRDGVLWVPQFGGHAFVGNELIEQGASRNNIWGYVGRWTGEHIEIISWNSGVLNNPRSVPIELRSQIVDMLRRQTGLNVFDMVR